MTEPLLSVRDLNVTFQGNQERIHAVRGISYDVRKGEFLGIVGESGSGKSVSSMAIMGLLPGNAEVSGEILFEGRNLLELDDRELSAIRGRDIAMVFQDPLSALTPVYTIGQQIAEGLQLHDRSLSKQAARARAVDLLRVVGIPSPERRVDSFPHEFSGGMRQRAMIAIAIANDPKLIIADEPTTALDVTIQAQILEVLQEAKDITGAAVVLITHDLGVVAGNADQVAVMYAGRIIEHAPVDDVFLSPAMPYTIGLLRSMPNMAAPRDVRLVPLEGRPPTLTREPTGCPFAPRCPAAIEQCLDGEPPLDPVPGYPLNHRAACIRSGEIATGRLPREEIFPRPENLPLETTRAAESAPLVELVDVKKTFPVLKGSFLRRKIGEVRAVDGVSFKIERGSVLGLVGESGSGKTTTASEILELVAPESGVIRIDGKDLATLSTADRKRLRGDVQIVFQDPMASLDPRMTVGAIVGEPLTVQRVPKQEIEERVARVLGLVGLDPAYAGRYPHQFSGGQRQRIGIARALIVEPKLLVLDEPVSALDVSIQAGVLNLLEDLRARLGLTYLFVAHDLAVVRHISDSVAVMYLGRIVEYGPSDALFSRPRHPYSVALLSAVPVPDPVVERSRKRVILTGDLPSPLDHVPGCNFRTRCPLYAILPEERREKCRNDDPRTRPVDGREVACHWAEDIELIGA